MSDDGLRWEFTVAWDDEPKMGGGNHRRRTGSYPRFEDAELMLGIVKARSNHAPKHGLRIERRVVGQWIATSAPQA